MAGWHSGGDRGFGLLQSLSLYSRKTSRSVSLSLSIAKWILNDTIFSYVHRIRASRLMVVSVHEVSVTFPFTLRDIRNYAGETYCGDMRKFLDTIIIRFFFSAAPLSIIQYFISVSIEKIVNILYYACQKLFRQSNRI